MDRATIAFREILKQAQQLPLKAQRQLAETLLRGASEDEQVLLIAMRQFGPGTQKRFQDLMERHNEGQLNPSEHAELKTLVARHKAMMLLNTEALLKAASPELFTQSGRLKQRRLDRAQRSCQRAQTGKLAAK
jgi:hypothetical protein